MLTASVFMSMSDTVRSDLAKCYFASGWIEFIHSLLFVVLFVQGPLMTAVCTKQLVMFKCSCTRSISISGSESVADCEITAVVFVY